MVCLSMPWKEVLNQKQKEQNGQTRIVIFLEKTKKANKNLKTLRICVMKLQHNL